MPEKPEQPDGERFCEVRDLLQRIDAELEGLAQRYKEEPEARYKKRLRARFKEEQEYREALQQYEEQLNEITVPLISPDDPKTRSKQVDAVMRVNKMRGDLRPESWEELADRMWFDHGLQNEILKQYCCRYLKGEDDRDVLQFTQVRLYHVVVRNAGKWHRREHGRDWYGYLKKQIPEQTKRATKEVRPHKGEEPIGHQGGEQGQDVLDLLEDCGLPPDRLAEFREQRQRLAELRDQLSPDEREILRMRYDDGMLIREIAGQLGVSESAVKNRLKRALDKLRRMLEGDEDDARAGP